MLSLLSPQDISVLKQRLFAAKTQMEERNLGRRDDLSNGLPSFNSGHTKKTLQDGTGYVLSMRWVPQLGLSLYGNENQPEQHLLITDAGDSLLINTKEPDYFRPDDSANEAAIIRDEGFHGLVNDFKRRFLLPDKR